MPWILAAVSLGCAAVAWRDRRTAMGKERRSQGAGTAGERMVAGRLTRGGFEAIHDLHIRLRGRTMQVDHLVLCDGRIECLETKHWAGEILARTDQEDWKVTSRAGRTSSRYSPLRQNSWHVAKLSEAFRVPVHGLLVFTSAGGRLRGDVPECAVSLAGLGRELGRPPSGPQENGLAQAWSQLSALKADSGMQAKLARVHLARIRGKHRRTDAWKAWAGAALVTGAAAFTVPPDWLAGL